MTVPQCMNIVFHLLADRNLDCFQILALQIKLLLIFVYKS